jgi:hypothetical protein
MHQRPHPFPHLAARFDELARSLSECQHDEDRREILKEMRAVIDQFDQLYLNEPHGPGTEKH